MKLVVLYDDSLSLKERREDGSSLEVGFDRKFSEGERERPKGGWYDDGSSLAALQDSNEDQIRDGSRDGRRGVEEEPKEEERKPSRKAKGGRKDSRGRDGC